MMVVVDANLFVALVSGDPRGTQVQEQFLKWVNDGIELHAPALARYEGVASAVRRDISVKGVHQSFTDFTDAHRMPPHQCLNTTNPIRLTLRRLKPSSHGSKTDNLAKLIGD